MGLTFVLLMVANLLIELSVLMVVRGLWTDQRMGRLLLTCVTVNLVSYPLAYLCIEQDGLPYGATEALVFLTEGMLYCLTLEIKRIRPPDHCKKCLQYAVRRGCSSVG